MTPRVFLRPHPVFAGLGVRRRFLALSPDEVSFASRGFRDTAARPRFEEIGRVFLRGYDAALDDAAPAALADRLNAVDRPLRGFAFEGAAMSLALLDGLTPWRRDRLAAFLVGPGAPHVYMVHVGAGWAAARLPWRSPTPPGPPLDPLLAWLALDGYGFHQGYFHPAHFLHSSGHGRDGVTGYASRVFDQGLGRALWFVEGADVARVVATLRTFPSVRQPDLWSGVGLAATYAGGVDLAALTALRRSSGAFAPHVAQGAAFAAKARQAAAIVTPDTEQAVRALCGVSTDSAAAIADEMRTALLSEGGVPAYEVWRRRVRWAFTHQENRDVG